MSKGFELRRLYPLCAIMAYAMLSMLPSGAAAQGGGDPPTLGPGLHDLRLQRPGEPAVRYTIYIPSTYVLSRPVPLILALHYGVGGQDPDGAGGQMLQILIGPALVELGAIIVAPDSVRGNWSSPENEKAVNALLDMVLAKYEIDRKKIAVTGYSMGGAGTWHFAEKYPDRFSAAIPIAGRPPESAAGWHLPVLAIPFARRPGCPVRPDGGAHRGTAEGRRERQTDPADRDYALPNQPLPGCVTQGGAVVTGGLEIGTWVFKSCTADPPAAMPETIACRVQRPSARSRRRSARRPRFRPAPPWCRRGIPRADSTCR